MPTGQFQQGSLGFGLGSLLKKPLIVTIHGSDLRMALESAWISQKNFCLRMQECQSTSIVFQNVQKKEMEQLGITSEKISVIPMGVDEAFLEMGKNRKIELNKASIHHS